MTRAPDWAQDCRQPGSTRFRAPGNNVVDPERGKGVLPKLFLGVLAVAWIVVLVPPVLRARNDSRNRGDSIGDFQNRLGVLARSHSRRGGRARAASLAKQGRVTQGPHAALAPMPRVGAPLDARRRTARVSRTPAALTGPVEPMRTRAAERSARRRREVVTVLFTTTMLSAAVASAIGASALWGLQILCDVALLGYVVGMLWFKNNGVDRKRTVHYLPQVRPRPVAAYALRRTASS